MNQGTVCDTLILGGGAAGLYSALTAVRAGQSVVLIEKTEYLGKKLSLTGNGRCNFTHQTVSARDYRTDDPEALEKSLNLYGVEETLRDFSSLGIYPVLKNEGYYPASFQASAVVSLLTAELEKKDRGACTILRNRQVKGIEKTENGFRVRLLDLTAKNRSKATSGLYGRRVIMAMGGASYPKTGSNGDGYYYLKKLGHSIDEPLPALTPLKVENYDSDLFGVRQSGSFWLESSGQKILSSSGELQFTKTGLSGIAIFQLSMEAVPLIKEGEKPRIHCDFFPDLTAEDLARYLLRLCENADPDMDLSILLSGLLQKSLSNHVLKRLGLGRIKVRDLFSGEITSQASSPGKSSLKTAAAEDRSRKKSLTADIAEALKDLTFSINGYENFSQAQTTRGGVLLSEIHPETMESRLCPGLYFAGEIVNVNGFCGGYNLQWAWTSGHLAGFGKSNEKKVKS
ncbi:MAG: aminoacetone oxidase family FAD-binding enzyme [Lachnospiraceae bacterium]|nr:aminoacetone oxidase family FAD-binding enzyme [Lachnospiraceae bacterium]